MIARAVGSESLWCISIHSKRSHEGRRFSRGAGVGAANKGDFAFLDLSSKTIWQVAVAAAMAAAASAGSEPVVFAVFASLFGFGVVHDAPNSSMTT